MVPALSTLSELRSLDLSDSALTSQDIKALKVLKSLKKLVLQNFNIKGIGHTLDELAEILPELTSLTELDLSSTFLSEVKFVQTLEKLLKLESLNLSSWLYLSGKKLTSVLTKLSGLKRLYIKYCNNIPGKELAAALEKMPGLQELDISGCTQIPWGKLKTVLESSRITRLGLTDCSQIPSYEYSGIREKIPNHFQY